MLMRQALRDLAQGLVDAVLALIDAVFKFHPFHG